MDAAIKTLTAYRRTLLSSIEEGKNKGVRMTITEEVADAIAKALVVMDKAKKEAV